VLTLHFIACLHVISSEATVWRPAIASLDPITALNCISRLATTQRHSFLLRVCKQTYAAYTHSFDVSTLNTAQVYVYMRLCFTVPRVIVSSVIAYRVHCEVWVCITGRWTILATAGVDDGRICGDEPAWTGSRVGLRDSFLTQHCSNTLPCVHVQL